MKRGATAAAAAAAADDTKTGESHTASTGIGSTQGYKPKPPLLHPTVIVMIFITGFSSTFEYAYAEMFMFVSVISFYGLKNVTKWLNIQQGVRAVAAAPHTVRSGGVTVELAASPTPPRVPSSRRRVR